MGAVGGDEVDQRFRVLEVQGEIQPAGIGLELAVAGHGIELGARLVQRWHAGIATAGEIDRRQVQRQAKQVAAQGTGDELVDLVAQLPGQATNDGASSFFGRQRAIVIERQRVEEGLDQPHAAVVLEARVEAIHGLGQHRVTEAIHGVSELGHDRRVDGGVVTVGDKELVHQRLHLTGELLEHQVLILHLGTELGGLEQPFAVPYQTIQIARHAIDRHQQPLVEEGNIASRGGLQNHFLGVFDQAVVLGMEHMVHGGQANVLVDPAVAGHEVGVEQFVVIGAGLG